MTHDRFGRSCRACLGVLAIVTIICVSGCAKKEQVSDSATETPVAAPLILDGRVTFVSGKVSAKEGGTETALEIGSIVHESASVTTGPDSTCEIQFGTFGAVRLEQKTTLLVSALVTNPASTSSEMSLAAGTVVCKVRKLGGQDRFRVRTADMVAGVRGTRFMVSAESGVKTTVAVEEGSVMILPSSVPQIAPASSSSGVAKSDGKASAAGSTETSGSAASPGTAIFSGSAITDAAIARIAEKAPVIEAGKEITVSASSLSRSDAALKAVLAAAAAVSAPDSTESTDKTNATDAGTVSLPASVSGKIDAFLGASGAALSGSQSLSDTSKAVFSRAVKLEIRESAVIEDGSTPAGAADSSASDSGEAATPATFEWSMLTKASQAKKVSSDRILFLEPGTGGAFFACDAKSSVISCSPDGSVLWTAVSENGSNANSAPVVSGQYVALAGAKSLEVFSAADGKKLWSRPLDSSSTGLYGRHPAIAADTLAIGTSSGVLLFGAGDGAERGSIDFSDGSDMSPAFEGDTLYIVSKGGFFQSVDVAGKTVSNKVATQAVQPVAGAPVIRGNRAVFCDRKGTVTAVSLDSFTVLWQKRLDDAASVEVFSTPVVTDSGVYIAAKGRLYALSLASGARLFAPVDGVATQACPVRGALACGAKGGSLLILDAKTGKSLARAETAAPLSGAPLVSGSMILAPLSNGEVLLFDMSPR